MKRKTSPLNDKEVAAIGSLLDIASTAVSDSEHDHLKFSGRTRRNGGYSQDVRIAYRALTKLTNALAEGDK